MTSATPPPLLPNPLTPFIGHQSDLDELTRLFSVGAARLVALTGAGGCGKTRLALALAERLVAEGHFEHGIWAVELAGLSSPDLVSQTVATALGLPETQDQPILAALCQYLQPQAALLVLDNCEHLLPACADLVRAVSAAAPRVAILATSREPLGLPAETVWLVPSLSLPQPESGSPVADWLQTEALQLFSARAQAALPEFQLTADNAATVARICRQLDGIPLAIELAAARVKMLDVEQIAARLEGGLQLLARGSRQSTPRHQTMRAALDWSYELLSPPAQHLFGQLAVFAGGFALEAAEQVGASDPSQPPAPEVLDLLSDLVDKSMVSIAARPVRAPVRYRLLEPIRQYAQEKLRQAGGEPAARDRHLAFFVGFAEQAASQLQTAQQRQWLQRLDQEYDNLRSALGWSAQAASRAPAALRLASALHRYWYQRGRAHEGRQWLGQAIANHAAQPAGSATASEHFLAQALVADGWLAIIHREYQTRPPDLERALALARQWNEPVIEAQALGLLGLLSGYRGDEAAVTRQYDQDSLEAAQRSGDIWTQAWAVHLLGLHRYYHWREPGAAHSALEASASLFEQTGDQRWLAVVANLRGIITAHSGDYAAAQRLYEGALVIAQDLDDQELQWKEWFNLGGLAVVQNDAARADVAYRHALALGRRSGNRLAIAESLQGLAQVHLMRSEIEPAGLLLHESLALVGAAAPPNLYIRLLAKFARVAAARGQAVSAARALGAIDAYLAQRADLVDIDERVPLAEHRAWVQATLGAEAFALSSAAGQALTLEQAMQAVVRAEPAPLVSGGGRPTLPIPSAWRLYALGPMRVQGQAPIIWPYGKVKELLFYLASQPPRTKAQIGLALWPEASSAQLRHSLGTTLYHLRRALGSPGWVLFADDYYHFNLAPGSQFDVTAFETSLAEAARHQRHAPEQALPQLEAAIALYQGEFVEDLVEGEWFRLRREQLRRQYLNALLDVGQLHFARGDFAAAAQTYRRAIEKENVLERAHRELMRCYERLGERGQALRHYQTLEEVMRTELGAPPAPESVALYAQLKRGDPA